MTQGILERLELLRRECNLDAIALHAAREHVELDPRRRKSLPLRLRRGTQPRAQMRSAHRTRTAWSCRRPHRHRDPAPDRRSHARRQRDHARRGLDYPPRREHLEPIATGQHPVMNQHRKALREGHAQRVRPVDATAPADPGRNAAAMVKTMTVVELDVHGRSRQAAAMNPLSGLGRSFEACGRDRCDSPPLWRDADPRVRVVAQSAAPTVPGRAAFNM